MSEIVAEEPRPAGAPEDRATDGPRYLEDPTESWSEQAPEDVAWASTDIFALGELHVGVRASTEQWRDRIARFLTAQHVAGVAPGANFSVLATGPAQNGAAPGYHVLYRGARPVVHTASAHRLLAALAAHLDLYVSPPPDDLLLLTAVAAVRDGRAVVLPTLFRNDLPLVERRLHDEGIQVVDAPQLVFDANALELVLSEPGLSLDWSVADEAARDDPPARADLDSAVPAGRYPLARWTLGVAPQFAGDALTPSLALLESSTWLASPARLGAQRSLETLVGIFDRLPPVGLHWSSADELVDGLTSIW